MDILGRERDKLQAQLSEAHAMLAESHEMIRVFHQKFLEALAAPPRQDPAKLNPSGALMFSQNRVRRAVVEA